MSKHYAHGAISLGLISEPFWSHPLQTIDILVHLTSGALGLVIGLWTLHRMWKNKDSK